MNDHSLQWYALLALTFYSLAFYSSEVLCLFHIDFSYTYDFVFVLSSSLESVSEISFVKRR